MSSVFAATAALTTSSGAATAIVVVIALALGLFELVAFWKLFAKAGKPGWATLIPIYNFVVLLRITGKSGWWLLLFFIPFINVVAMIIVLNELSRSFGRSGGFTIGLVFLSWLFVPILAFGSDM